MPTSEFAASFGRLAANHLWQSTGFAAVAVLLALALRANHARARYWLWLAASVKFLVPFSVLAGIGASLGRWFVPATPISRLPSVMQQIVQPFAPVQDSALPAAASAPVTANLLPALLLAFWFCGFAAVLLYAWTRWRRVAAAVHSSTPLTGGRELEAWGRLAARQPAGRLSIGPRGDYQSPRSLASCPTTLRLVSSAAKLGPGVFGILRPVLWLPAGIGDRLDDAELEAILAHELCHIRRSDNLLAAIHMAVEAIFWFHPLVWWLGSRLEEERERACDEEVLRMGGEPQIYAESILKVCEFYLASPVACAAGVTGGELKETNRGHHDESINSRIGLRKESAVDASGGRGSGRAHGGRRASPAAIAGAGWCPSAIRCGYHKARSSGAGAQGFTRRSWDGFAGPRDMGEGVAAGSDSESVSREF
jgi:beta-lactamase regulating signal transducer with metallopeptidase domain